MKGNSRKRVLAVAMSVISSVSIFLSVLPNGSSEVSAATPRKAISVGAGVLGFDSNTSKAATVYFGADGKSPIAWRVVGNDQHGVGHNYNRGNLTLLSNKVIKTEVPFDEKGLKNEYSGSTLHDNVYSISENDFSEAEKSAFSTRRIPVGDYLSEEPYTDGVAGSELSTAHLWALSSNEAFLLDPSIRKTDAEYWLRSPGYKSSFSAYVNINGALSYLGIDSITKKGVRPAFNLRMASVVLASPAKNGKPSASANVGTLSQIKDYTGNQWKLTILDRERSGFTAYLKEQKVYAGQTCHISYSDAVLKTTDKDECVSVVLLDSTATPIYYGCIAYRSKNGTAEMKIPSGLPSGKYKLIVFAEQRNGDYYTDYASNVVEFSIEIDNTLTPNPAVPNNVKAVATSSTRAKVSWDAVPGATGYVVYRSLTQNGSYTRLGTVEGTNRVCTGLTAGKMYYFKVRAIIQVDGVVKYSDNSETVSVVPPIAGPSELKVTSVSNTAVKLAWDAVPGATGYVVYRSTTPDGTYTRLATLNATNRKCPGLTSGTMYYFKVRSYIEINGTKYYGNFSPVVSAVPSLPAPENVKAVKASANTAKVSWNAVSGATGYVVYRSTSADGSYTRLATVSSTSRNCSGLASGQTYYFKIRAITVIDGTTYYGSMSEPARYTVN